MSWYWIVLLSVLGVHLVNTVVVFIFEQRKSLISEYIWIFFFLVYIPLRIVLYPVWAIMYYNASSGYFKKHGISKLQFVFGKRVKRETIEE